MDQQHGSVITWTAMGNPSEKPVSIHAPAVYRYDRSAGFGSGPLVTLVTVCPRVQDAQDWSVDLNRVAFVLGMREYAYFTASYHIQQLDC